MENINYKKYAEGVLLYILKSGDRNSNEIKELYDQFFYNISQSTLYTFISNHVDKGHLKEYRFSNPDGSRRKYYQLTEKGLKFFENNYGTVFDNAPIIETKTQNNDSESKNIDVKVNVKKQPKKEVKIEPVINQEHIIANENVSSNNYDDIISDIDFTSLVKPTTTPTPNAKSVVVEKRFTENPNGQGFVDNSPKYTDDLIKNLDNVNDKTTEYTSVLKNLYPKANVIKIRDNKEQNIEDEQSNTQHKEIIEKKNELDEFSKNNGFNIRTSNDTNNYSGNNIKIGLVRVLSISICYLISLILIGLQFLLFKNDITFNSNIVLTYALIGIVAVALFLVIFLFNTKYVKKDLPKFKDMMELALIATIASVGITAIFCVIKEVDFKNVEQLIYNLLLPAVFEIQFPIYTILVYSLSKNSKFQC